MGQGLTLDDIRACCEGVLPASITTCAPDGTPNLAYLSKVVYVDQERVGLSNQFFSKTARNLARNPRAMIMVIDPRTMLHYRIAAEYERSVTRGPLVDAVRAEIDAIASMVGMENVFRLRAVDIYRVREVSQVPSTRD